MSQRESSIGKQNETPKRDSPAVDRPVRNYDSLCGGSVMLRGTLSDNATKQPVVLIGVKTPLISTYGHR